MRWIVWAVALVGACGGDKDGTETTDTDTTVAETTETSDTTETTETTETTAETDLPAETDPPEETVPAGDTIPPMPLLVEPPDYTLFFDGSALNIYWRAGADDVTTAEMLQYQVHCQAPGQLDASVTMDWTAVSDLRVEGSGRYWYPACAGAPGLYGAWVSIRDEAGNVGDFPMMMGDITGRGPR